MFKENRWPNQKWLSKKIEIKASTVHGAGVFATENIEKREVFEICPVILFHKSLLKSHYDLHGTTRHILDDYVFKWESSAGNIAIALGGGCIYNHSNDNFNACYRMLDEDTLHPRMAFIATKDILAGEEIFIRYTKSAKLIFDGSGTFMTDSDPQKASLDQCHPAIRHLKKS